MIGFFAAIAITIAYIILSKPTSLPVSMVEPTSIVGPTISPISMVEPNSPISLSHNDIRPAGIPTTSPPELSFSNIIPIRNIKPRQQNISDMGYSYKPRGWYDMQNQGVRNDYCRWVGSYPLTWFSCALAGSNDQLTPNSAIYNDSNPHDILPGDIVLESDDIGLFDENGYYILHPDVKNAGMNAKVHYCQYGYNEGRKIKNIKGTIGAFDKNAYYTLHPDVKNAGMDALTHFCNYGFNEKREIKVTK